MKVVADAGALIALERNDPQIVALYAREAAAGRLWWTHGGIVGQVWRTGTGKQSRLAKYLEGMRVIALDEALGKRAGALLGRARRSDVNDAAVVLLAGAGDQVLTSDPDDLGPLAEAAGLEIDLIEV
jgi:hypothetical protein